MSMLKVENLSVHYGMIQAVRDVSFEVNEGEVVSLIGANGCLLYTSSYFHKKYNKILDSTLR